MDEDEDARNAESDLLGVVQEKDPMDSIRRAAVGAEDGPPQLLLGGLLQLPSLSQHPDLTEVRESTTSPPAYDGWCTMDDQASGVASDSQSLSEASEIGDLSQAHSESSADTEARSLRSFVSSSGSPRAAAARYDAGTCDERLRSHSAIALGYADLTVPQEFAESSELRIDTNSRRAHEVEIPGSRQRRHQPRNSLQQGVSSPSESSAAHHLLAQSMELQLEDSVSSTRRFGPAPAGSEGELGSDFDVAASADWHDWKRAEDSAWPRIQGRAGSGPD